MDADCTGSRNTCLNIVKYLLEMNLRFNLFSLRHVHESLHLQHCSGSSAVVTSDKINPAAVSLNIEHTQFKTLKPADCSSFPAILSFLHLLALRDTLRIHTLSIARLCRRAQLWPRGIRLAALRGRRSGKECRSVVRRDAGRCRRHVDPGGECSQQSPTLVRGRPLSIRDK